MTDRNTLLAQFQGIADTSEERARFFLESANWELQVALSSFYDNPVAGEMQANDMDIDPHPDISGSGSNQPAANLLVPPQPTKQTPVEHKKKTKSSRFASLKDLSPDEDASSEEEGQRFYAGGSEHSGELIVGPPRKKLSNEEITKNLFKEAKKHGAKAVDASSRDAEKSGDSKPKYFGGGGYKLGGSQNTSEFIPGNEEPPENRPVSTVLKLWSNGFSVDDGPLRDFSDPANEEFLNSIKKGEIPRELLRKSHGGEVNVDMEDHRQEEYKVIKKKLKPFTGQGYMLGSPTPEFTSNSTRTNTVSSPVDPPIIVDKAKPTTIVQVRLADGKRLRQEFNQSHRISAIRSFVVSSHPESASRPFVLMTTFPNKELSDENMTLSEAKLLNAVVLQKMI